jgi:SOS response regulatory protein OraA/RecX
VVVISTQEAFARAKQYATELLGERDYTLEELEQDLYKDPRVWRITLGFPKRRISAPELMRSIAASLPLEYKTILVDIETGEPVAMKLAS